MSLGGVLRTDDELLICLGSSATSTVMVPVRINELLEDDREYQIKMYTSELADWQQGENRTGRTLRELAVGLETGGYRLLCIQPA